jgi:MFS family permease
LYWSSLLVSAIGDQSANVTIAWQIYEITHSPLQLGLTGLFRGLPILIFSLGGGLLADRASRRKVLVGTQSVGMKLTLILGFLTCTGLVRVWQFI